MLIKTSRGGGSRLGDAGGACLCLAMLGAIGLAARADERLPLRELSFASPRWMAEWHVGPGRKMGWKNLEVGRDPAEGAREPFLRARFPKGSASPTVTRA